jgi:hypothetical protein
LRFLLIVAHLAQADITAQLEGYWTFENSPTDVSGAARDFTVSNTSYVPGLIGQSLSLTGSTSSYAVRPIDDNVFDFGSSNFALQVWINWTNTVNEQVVIEKFNNDSGPGWTLTKLGDNRIGFHFTSSNTPTSAAQTLATGLWHQLLVNRGGNWLDVYLDNSNIIHSDQTGLVVANVSQPLLLGKRNDGDGRGFASNAKFDEVAIWSRALTSGEINSLWNNGNGMPIPEPATISLLTLAGITLLRRRA